METKQFKASEISEWKKWKWLIEDMAGLYIHKFIAVLSRDPEVKKLYKEMKKQLIEEGNQPEAIKISKEIRSKIMINTQKRLN